MSLSPPQLIDRAPCGLLTLAADGGIVDVNRAFLTWTRYSRERLVGVRRLDELFTVPCRIYYETHQAPLLRLQGFVNEIATDFVRSDGSVFPAFVNVVEERDGEPGEAGMIAAVFDASDRRRYERELMLARRGAEEALRAKAEFLAMFAHEIRNPLSAIALQVEMLDRKGAAHDPRVAMSRLHSSVDRVLALVNNMLDISKLDAGKVTLEKTDFAIGDVIGAVIHTMSPLAERKGLLVQVAVDNTLPERVRGDPMKLDQALTNLVGNAIKFTERGAVTLDARCLVRSPAQARVRFQVSDTGIGVPSEQQQSIFDEYAQADASVARRFGGTGLGLTITRKLVNLLGGQLTLDSEPGRGSTFAFDISLEPVAPA